jgi:trehalose 6-phosphate phosphatase
VAEVSLFLDLDGTVAPIVARPDLVGPDPRRNKLLRHIADALESRLAIVSGRSIDDIDRITANAGYAAAGLHGLERRGADVFVQAVPHPEIDKAAELIDMFARTHEGLLVEKKGLAIALHYRGAPALADDALALARRVAWATGLTLQEGNMVAELRCPGPNKGDVLSAYMHEAPFKGHTPIFIGDDLTDENGFVAAQALGGYGVLVGPERETAATCRLKNVDEVLSWLEASVALGAFRLVRAT